MSELDPHGVIFDAAPSLEQLKQMPAEKKSRVLLARLSRIGARDGNALNKANLMLPGDPYQLAYGYSAGENIPVRQHLLGGPWTRLVNDGHLADIGGHGFFTVTEEGQAFLSTPPADQAEMVHQPRASRTPPPSPEVPRVLLSYAWEGEEHKAWVLHLDQRLRHDGIDVLLDHWHLNPGDDRLHFMEEAVSNSDFVIEVCTPRYAERANKREGGVGYESLVITGEIAEHIHSNKFIPVLRKGNWKISSPRYLKPRLGVDLTGDPYSELEYERLLRVLHGEQLKPPPIGPKPVFSASAAAPTEDAVSGGTLTTSTARKPPRSEAANQRTAIHTVSHFAADGRLGAKEMELLWQASQDPGGQVCHIKAIGGERLSVNQETYPEQRDARSSAEWFGALHSLVALGFLEGVGRDADYYRLTARGWQQTDGLSDFAIWKVAELKMERRYFGDTPPEELTLACRKIVQLPVELFPDQYSVKEPKTFMVEGINLGDPQLKRGLPFEPTHVGVRDPSTNEPVWFCVYEGTRIAGRYLRIPING